MRLARSITHHLDETSLRRTSLLEACLDIPLWTRLWAWMYLMDKANTVSLISVQLLLIYVTYLHKFRSANKLTIFKRCSLWTACENMKQNLDKIADSVNSFKVAIYFKWNWRVITHHLNNLHKWKVNWHLYQDFGLSTSIVQLVGVAPLLLTLLNINNFKHFILKIQL